MTYLNKRPETQPEGNRRTTIDIMKIFHFSPRYMNVSHNMNIGVTHPVDICHSYDKCGHICLIGLNN